MINSLTRSLIDAGTSYRVGAEDLLDATLPDIGDRRAKASAFWMLLACSSIIAAAGVLSNSTAVVIGAMVIAPLGTPIYGIAASLVAGIRSRRAVLRVLGGCALAVAIGFAVDVVTVERIAVTANPQILSRTSPSLIDLGVAFATGVAGSMALVRTDISPALPGVAIAISLVPPLTVVGITLHAGEPHLALGAAMLFATNMLAIVLAGLIVFKGAGIDEPFSDKRIRAPRARFTLVVATVVIVVALAVSSVQALRLMRDTNTVHQAAVDWAKTHPTWSLRSVEDSGDSIVVTFIGSGTPPDLSKRASSNKLAQLKSDGIKVVVTFEQGGEVPL